MFENIGAKIKTLSYTITIVGIIVSVIAAIVLFVEEMVGLGLLVGICGVLMSWVGSFVLYGFGELVENSAKIAKNTNNTLQLNALQARGAGKSQKTNPKAKIINSVIEEIEEEEYQEELAKNPDFDPENIAKKDECPACFHKIAKTDTECGYCGYKLK